MVSNITIWYESFINWSIWSTNGTLTGTSTPGESGPRSYGNGRMTPLNSKTGALLPDGV